MLKFCPVNFEKADEMRIRITALLVVGLVAAVLFGKLPWLLGLLAADFFWRGFGPRKWSPLAKISGWLAAKIQAPARPIDLAPKQFAARIGFFLTTAAAVFYLVGWSSAGFWTAATVGFFAALEGVFGFCVACVFYPFVFRWQEKFLVR